MIYFRAKRVSGCFFVVFGLCDGNAETSCQLILFPGTSSCSKNTPQWEVSGFSLAKRRGRRPVIRRTLLTLSKLRIDVMGPVQTQAQISLNFQNGL